MKQKKIMLKALQKKNLPKANIYTLKIKPELKEKTSVSYKYLADTVRLLNRYFSNFLANDKCPNCETQLSGLFGSFEWGLVHGEGYCKECGYPCRCYHFINDENGQEKAVIRNMILPYHPSILK